MGLASGADRGTRVEIKVLSPTAIEDFHAHLVRLDRTSCLPGTDDHAIDRHCLELIASGAILIGVYENGAIRAAAEIVPDRTARRAEAAITVEDGYADRGFERELTEHVVEEARRHHLQRLRLHEQNAVRSYYIPTTGLASAAA
jgi:GNAT superfamily N-acetyltransferase